MFGLMGEFLFWRKWDLYVGFEREVVWRGRG